MKARYYKLIIFDLGGTVFTKGKQYFIDLLAKKYQKDPISVSNVVDSPLAIEYRRGRIDSLKYWLYLKSQLDLSLTPNQLQNLWFEQYKPQEGMTELLSELRKRHILAYLSNNIPERVHYLESKYKFKSWFDTGVLSYEVGAVKGDRVLLLELLRQFPSIDFSEILYVDDKPENLTYPAHLGVRGICYKSTQQLHDLLIKRGVL